MDTVPGGFPEGFAVTLVDDSQGGQAPVLTAELGYRKGPGVAAGRWDGSGGNIVMGLSGPGQDTLNPHHPEKAYGCILDMQPPGLTFFLPSESHKKLSLG